MAQSGGTGANGVNGAAISQVLTSFRQSVIEQFHITIDGQNYNYRDYLALPEARRSGDEANAVDVRFTRLVLEWLGFSDADWVYNEPVQGKKANRPDYSVKGTVGTSFIWEDKNSSLDLDEKEHITQMRRYVLGTAGYAVWCNMRRIHAIRFAPDDTLRYEVLANISIEDVFGTQAALPFHVDVQSTNLALFRLLFSKSRFTQFSELVQRIATDEQTFEDKERGAISFEQPEAIRNFIAGSRESLSHLRLAALSRIRDALERRERLIRQEAALRQEWESARKELADSLTFTLPKLVEPLFAAIDQLTTHLGEIEVQELQKVQSLFEKAARTGTRRISVSMRAVFDRWLVRASQVNSALLTMHFTSSEPFRIAEAYRLWSERQSDKEDILPEVFAEQVGYVFFVRLLLVRVLEDKHILRPRLASNGGFLDWSGYVSRHFQELEGISILNEKYSSILARKAGQYYMHFFRQPVFDWFMPEDFLFVETLEFLCRYNFQHVTSDIIGFTYEEYIERNARNRKGHFLTRGEVVDYMLDLLDYSGPPVIGRRIFDPACGSGSFLVHASRRYRQALITYFCTTYNVATEEQLYASAERRAEVAHRYLDDLTSLFFGMELNPFACYLAEMNLLIQGLDDLAVLQASGDKQPIERFQIYNSDSLSLPFEVLDSDDVTGTVRPVLVTDSPSYRLVDEAYPIKARLDSYMDGFFYIISNPPYVSSKQEEMDVTRYRDTEFYGSILTGDTNLYLLFLRLGLYYLSDYGQMIYIMPLTIFGDRSASAARKLLKTPPFSPSAAVRFYRGDILFPGVDQAVGIVRVNRSHEDTIMTVSGGYTVVDARAAQFQTESANVIEAVPQNGVWQYNWLIAQSRESFAIWEYVRQKSEQLTLRLGALLDDTFDRKQGDVNATIINPLRIGANNGNTAHGDVAIYKGEDVQSFASLPVTPSDWIRIPAEDERLDGDVGRSIQVLEQLKHIDGKEVGIVLREVARLNTRERLIATWFERTASFLTAFTHETWRMALKSTVTEELGKAILALINSKTTAYLVNLFSTNNHVGKDDLGRVPIPDPQTLPIAQLAALANQLLNVRGSLEHDFVEKYHAVLPEFEPGTVYIPPSTVLAASRVPKLTIQALVGRGEVRNTGQVNGRIRTLRTRNIVSTIDPSRPYAASFGEILNLFLHEPGREEETWSQAQNWLLADPVASAQWLNSYRQLMQQAQQQWESFLALQQQVDEAVADWYGFDRPMRDAISQGLPWAQRRRM